jgi:PAS domain S-box-containing protein
VPRVGRKRKAASAATPPSPPSDEARWHALVNTARDAIVSIDASGHITLFNPTAERMFGYRAEEVLGQDIGMLMPPPYHDEHDEYIRTYQRTGVPKAIGKIRKVCARHKSGETFPIELSVSEVRTGEEIAFSAIIRDVTEREETEEALRRERDFAERLLETAQVIVLVLDRQGRIVRFNRYMEQISGYRLEEVKGADWFSIFIPEAERARIHRIFDEAVRDLHVHGRVNPIVTKAGTERLIEWYANSLKDHDGHVAAVLAIGQDVTERQRAEARLMAQFAVTRVLAGSASLQEATPALLQSMCEATRWEFGELWCAERDTGLLRWHGAWHDPGFDTAELEAVSRTLKLTRGQGLPGRAYATGEPAWLADVTTQLHSRRAALAAKLGLRAAFAFPVRARNVVIGVIAFYSRHARPPDNDLLQMLDAVGSQIGDFIDRKRAEEDLIRMSKAIESTSDAICMADMKARAIYHNRAFSDLYNYTVDGLNAAGGPAALFLKEGLADEVFGAVRSGRSWSGEVELKARDGRIVPTLLRADGILDETGNRIGFIGACTDMSERRRAEAELHDLEKRSIQRERLADIGAITAKLVHDIGNPLAGLSMQAQLVLRRVRLNETGETLLQSAEKVVSEVRRLEVLINEFREFSREQRLHREPIDVPHFLQEVVGLWQPVARPQAIALWLEAPEDVPILHADPDKLHRVFDNLVKNAVEAVEPGPGHVILRVTIPSPANVRISVEDTGPGIPETVDVFRLFETTKPDGSGLGLTIAKEIVLAHGGSIEFTSRHPHGTIFHVTLPFEGPPV